MPKFIFLLCLLLPACQSQSLSSAKPPRPDGPPPPPTVPIVYQDASPMDEPLSRHGNPSSYQVKGEEYEVLPSATGYHKRGIASWYGTKFHKERTSSGEPYDMYAFTAAHKTLPLPTYVRVKNLENGREAIVKVNDRGPFHEDRLIDLSYGAASKLGLLDKGTARVDIEALSSSPEARYYLQVGAFQSPSKADALRDKLAALNQETKVQIQKRDTRYVVQLGPFPDKKHSEDCNNLLKEHGIAGGYTYLQ